MALTSLLAAFIGLIGWTFTEYAMHHWVGHLGRGKNAFSREHLKHHRLVDYFTPWSGKVLRTLIVGALMSAVTVSLLGQSAGLAGTGGFLFGYTWYEYLHWSLHELPPRHAYGRWARRHHFHHHFENPKMNHGVTTPLWDLAFNTYEAPATIRVPKKLLMPWLLDPMSQEIRRAYLPDFRVR